MMSELHTSDCWLTAAFGEANTVDEIEAAMIEAAVADLRAALMARIGDFLIGLLSPSDL